MTKQEFLLQLRQKLSGLPQDDINERLTFYSEIIDDRMEEGLSEDEAILAVGTVKEITAQIIADIPLAKIAKERIKSKRRLKVWEIILLALGSPIWLSLSIAALSVILSVYISLWSVIASLWAVFVALAVYPLGSIAAGTLLACNNNVPTGILMVGTGLACTGLAIFMFYGCKTATKGFLIFTQKIAAWIKNRFIKKEEA